MYRKAGLDLRGRVDGVVICDDLAGKGNSPLPSSTLCYVEKCRGRWALSPEFWPGEPDCVRMLAAACIRDSE